MRRGFRGGKYVLECDQPVGSSNGNAAGVVLHYQDPENFMGVIFSKGLTNYTPKLVRRKDGDFSTISTGTAFAMTSPRYMTNAFPIDDVRNVGERPI